MSLVFNMVGGSGGISENRAVLVVRVPAGSTVTATKGGVTLTPKMWVVEADPTQDIALFVIAPSLFDSVNPWTVTATLGTNSASDTVTIDSNKQYDLTLAYRVFLCQNGAWNTSVAGTLTAKGVKITNDNAGGNAYPPHITYNSDNVYIYETQDAGTGYNAGIAYGASKISLLNKSTLSIRCNGVDPRSSSEAKVCLNVWTAVPTNAWANNRVATTLIKGNTTFSIDVSSLNDEYYIGVGMCAYNGQTSSVTMYEMYVD